MEREWTPGRKPRTRGNDDDYDVDNDDEAEKKAEEEEEEGEERTGRIFTGFIDLTFCLRKGTMSHNAPLLI